MTISSFNTIEEIIRSHVNIIIDNPQGWSNSFCEVCGDGRRTKPPRGGWKFNDEACAYHCFNCGITASFDPNRTIPYSKKISEVFKAYNIPKDLVNAIVFQKKINNSPQSIKAKSPKAAIKPIEIPDHFYKLSDADCDNVIAIKAKEYLRSRFVDPDSYPFYLSTGISNSQHPKDIHYAKLFHNRIIIPSMRNGAMVYYIARSLNPDSLKPYLNAPVPHANIIYGFDQLYSNPNNYLFITEGWFDAYHLNGVAVLENHMTKDQIEILQKSPRKKIIVPDRKGDSKKLAEQGVELGWGITLPEIGSCKDVTAAIKKYHKLYVLDSVMKNIREGEKAKFYLNFL